MATTLSLPLLSILERAAQALTKVPAADAFAVLAAFPIARDRENPGAGAPLSSRCADGAAFFAALADREPTIMPFALQLLVPFEPDEAVRLALEMCAIPVAEQTEALDGYAVRSAVAVLGKRVSSLPLETIVTLGLAGRMNDVASELIDHPELQTVDQRRALLHRLERRTEFFAMVMRKTLAPALLEEGDAETARWLLATSHDRAHPFAADALFFLTRWGDREVLGQLAGRAAAALADPSATDHERHQTLLALMKLGDAERTVMTLTPCLGPAAVAADVRRAQWVLERLGSAVTSGFVPPSHRGLIDAVVPLLATPALRGLARALLAKMDRAAVQSATTAEAKPSKRAPRTPATTVASAGPSRTAATRVAPDDMVTRYRAGQHVQVWTELRALGPTVRDPGVITVARAVASETMRRFKTSVEAIVGTLEESHYNFAEKKPVAPPKRGAARKLDALEKLLGPLPIALRAFYEILDGVSLAEDPDAMTDDCTLDPELGRSDPLVIVPLDRFVAELEAQAAQNRGLREPLRGYLGPDPFHKYDPDDDYPDERPTTIALPEPDADGRVQGRFGASSFVEYLRLSVAHGGFSALGEGTDRDTLTRGVVPF